MDLFDQLSRALSPAYALERELGGGGMSRVFVARDNTLGRQVVVKVLPEDLAAGVSADRFQREIMVQAGLQHPHVVGVISAAEADGIPYFIMPYVEGESLRARLRDQERLSVRQTISIVKDVARGLAYAHERGIVHRDVKPDNVLLSGGSAALADFGVAKAIQAAMATGSGESSETLTRIGTSLGTPAYMAPEQIAGDADTDHRADIYALGAMMYEMLAGRPPFQAATSRELLAAHLAETPAPLQDLRGDVPTALADLVAQCLAKDPNDRPSNAAVIAEALDHPGLVSGATDTLPVLVTGALRRVRRARRASVFAGLAVVAAVIVLGTRAIGGGGGPPAGSIAVLPFVNVGRDTADAYFAEGMTDELIGALGRVPGLRVASRTSSFAFRNTSDGAQQIGRALNVATLLEGTVRREGEAIRISAQLVSSADGLTLWSDTFDREVTDVFGVQDELARAMTGALGGALGTAVAEVELQRGTEDLAAYDAYLRGRYFFRRRGAAALREALGYFHEATQLDPSYAPAHAGAADVYALLPLYSTADRDSVLPLALEQVNQAIALDPQLAAAFASRGNILNGLWRWDDAARDLERAIALDSQYVPAQQWYGENLMITGRLDEALARFRTAASLDPLDPVPAALAAVVQRVLGDGAGALQTARRAVELDSLQPTAHLMLAFVYLYGANGAEAIPVLERTLTLTGELPALRGALGYAHALAGDTAQARAILVTIDSAQPGAPAARARVYLGLGELDLAMQWFQRAAAARDPMFSSEPLAAGMFDPLRSRADFAALLDTIGLDPARLARTNQAN